MTADTGLDRTLARRVADGELELFGRLVEAHAPGITRYLARLLDDDATAADLAQETFLRAYQRIASYDPRWAFSTWLFRIAANLARDHVRAAGARERARLSAPPAEPAPAPRPPDHEHLTRALDALPLEQREVVLLHVYEGLTFPQIAALLGIPQGTAKSRMRYALRRLRGLLPEDSP